MKIMTCMTQYKLHRIHQKVLKSKSNEDVIIGFAGNWRCDKKSLKSKKMYQDEMRSRSCCDSNKKRLFLRLSKKMLIIKKWKIVIDYWLLWQREE